MKNKRVIITGGAGFIGSNLARELADDNSVIIIDNLSTGRLENISELQKDNKPVTFINGSILDLDLLRKTFKDADFVFHQAAIASVPRSIEDPLPTNNVNITGTLNVLLAARDNGIKKVVCASSSSVYGDTPVLPKKEDMSPNPRSPYAVTKLVGEHYCRVFKQVYGLPTVCLRYFNIYGPRQNPDSQYAAVIPVFISRVRQNMPPVIYGDGNHTRDFTFVLDAVRANIIAAESGASGVMNVGTGRNITIEALANTIINNLGGKMGPVHQEPRAGDVRDSLADISRLKKFGYEPGYTLQDGLQETIKYFVNA